MSFKPLGEIVSVKGGKRLPKGSTLQEEPNSHPYIRVKDMGSRYIPRSGLEFVPEDVFPKISRYTVNTNDVIISIVGTIGLVSVIDEFFDNASQTENCAKLTGLDKVDALYLYYFLRSEAGQSEIKMGTVGAVQAKLPLYNIEKLSIYWPLREVRQKIVSQLSTIDDKLECNAETNQTLEQIAQAIFKSWFVDFDPVKAKIETLATGGSTDDAELAAMGVISAKTLDELHGLKANNSEAFNKLAQTAALFPAAMQDSELGEIPEGWSYCTFGDISACFDSKRVPLSKRKREEKQPGTIPYYGATSVMDYVNEWIFDDTYLLLGEDGSVVKDDGTPFVQYIWGKSWVNNHAHVLQGNNGVSTEHLMVFIKGTNIASYVTGAVQLKLNQKNMNSIPFLKASTEINLVFQGVLNGLYDAYKNNIESSQSLSSLRDSLLPRLLSGEMDLKDKE
ncbi:restriction endonuclease subunit S [Shewanella algae]